MDKFMESISCIGFYLMIGFLLAGLILFPNETKTAFFQAFNTLKYQFNNNDISRTTICMIPLLAIIAGMFKKIKG